jgi:hypothetical protein
MRPVQPSSRSQVQIVQNESTRFEIKRELQDTNMLTIKVDRVSTAHTPELNFDLGWMSLRRFRTALGLA